MARASSNRSPSSFHGAAAEQVDPAAPKLARVRSRQQEAHAPGLDQAVYLVQECWEPLDLVDHHDAVSRAELLGEPAGALAERQVHRRVEEVIDLRLLEGITDQGRLAGLPRAQEEMGPLREQSGQVEQAGDPPMARGID
jgi:hypothetical protein